MEHVGVAIQVLRNVVVTGLDEDFIRGKFQGNLLVIRLETNSRENLGARDENGSKEITEPRTTIGDVIGVLFGHGIRPIRNFLEKFLEHDEHLPSI